MTKNRPEWHSFGPGISNHPPGGPGGAALPFRCAFTFHPPGGPGGAALPFRCAFTFHPTTVSTGAFLIQAVIWRLDISAIRDDLSAVRYLDPRCNLVFKKVFSRPRLLKSFLNALLPLKEPVEELEYLPVEELDAYDRYWDSIRCEVTLVEEAFDKGMGKGREQAKLEMAAKLKRQGLLSAEQIASVSGLTVEQVADI